jgi:outer membrane protein OmpA-like peptidoglycan-associated protein
VATRLKAEPYEDVTLTIQGRDVVLGGEATLEEDKTEAALQARAVAGVGRITNSIRVYGGVRLVQLEINATLLDGIDFDPGESVILERSQAVMKRLLGTFQRATNLDIDISGYTDNSGNEEENRRLSQERAQAVVGWLAEHGIDRGRMTAAGHGSSDPVASNETMDGRAKNRRIEIKIKEANH